MDPANQIHPQSSHGPLMWVFVLFLAVAGLIAFLAWDNRRRFERVVDGVDGAMPGPTSWRHVASLAFNGLLSVCCIAFVLRDYARERQSWHVRHSDTTSSALHAMVPAVMAYLDSEHALTSIVVVGIGPDDSSALLTLSRESKHSAPLLCDAAIAEAADNLAHPERLASRMDKAKHGSYGTVESL